MVKVIQGSQSSWSTPIIVVPKGDGGKCLVFDYHALNKVTQKFIWPMPNVEDIFSQLNGTKYFSMLDLQAGYHHIPLGESSIHKTAFTSPFGKYKYIKVPFGLMQAPAYFEEVMRGVLKDFSFAITYRMTSLSSAEWQKNTLATSNKFLKSWEMHTYQWSLANAISSLRKSSTSDTSSAPKPWDLKHQKPNPYTTCIHQKQLTSTCIPRTHQIL